jgi:hypothetical protein
MSDTTTSTTTTAVVDEDARVRAFTALGLGLGALLGGGVFANAFQWLAMKAFDGNDQIYLSGVAVGPLLMAVVSLWLALTTRTSSDALAGPLARATVALSALAVVGSVFLMAVTVGGI